MAHFIPPEQMDWHFRQQVRLEPNPTQLSLSGIRFEPDHFLNATPTSFDPPMVNVTELRLTLDYIRPENRNEAAVHRFCARLRLWFPRLTVLTFIVGEECYEVFWNALEQLATTSDTQIFVELNVNGALVGW